MRAISYQTPFVCEGCGFVRVCVCVRWLAGMCVERTSCTVPGWISKKSAGSFFFSDMKKGSLIGIGIVIDDLIHDLHCMYCRYSMYMVT